MSTRILFQSNRKKTSKGIYSNEQEGSDGGVMPNRFNKPQIVPRLGAEQRHVLANHLPVTCVYDYEDGPGKFSITVSNLSFTRMCELCDLIREWTRE